jgi:hypothetical protein
MIKFVRNHLQEQKFPEILETEEENLLSLADLKKKYLDYAKIHFQGHEFLNKNTGRPIKVSSDGVREWWVKSRRREHVISIQILNFFLENGILIDINPDYKGMDYIEGASRFQSKCKISDRLYRVIIIP